MSDNLTIHTYAGIVSGIFQTIIGHPLDTMKTLKQTNRYQHLNIYNAFRGLTYPLISTSILNSIQFSSASYFRYLLTNKYDISFDTKTEFIAGAAAGIVYGTFLSPVEYLKIKDQTMSTNARLGTLSCVLREIPGTSIYFGAYSYCRNHNIDIFLSGSIAGCLSWLLIYPLDVIKSQVQSGNSINIRNSIKFLMQNNKYLYNGIFLCLARGFISNGVAFYTYEKTLSYSLYQNQ